MAHMGQMGDVAKMAQAAARMTRPGGSWFAIARRRPADNAPAKTEQQEVSATGARRGPGR
jgi:hypothetical protein